MLKIEIKSKTYSNDIVLKNLELEITEPGLYGLIGKNGQGKTTLFKCALGLEKYEGKSYLGKEKVSLINTAFCPAEPILYDELTTEEFNEKLINEYLPEGYELIEYAAELGLLEGKLSYKNTDPLMGIVDFLVTSELSKDNLTSVVTYLVRKLNVSTPELEAKLAATKMDLKNAREALVFLKKQYREETK